MNDRFKFRAWAKGELKMKYSDDPNPDYELPCDELWGDSCYNLFQALCGFDEDEYILMQCTGLKGKNGKLIYEGDIVVCKMKHDLLNDEDGYQATVAWEHARWVTVDATCKDNEYLHDLAVIEELEVIGNIYENPELLN